jgi:hypothetical protein
MRIEEICKNLLIEMFKRVGLDYTYEQILEYAKKDEWYSTKTWTKEQENDFTSWAYTYTKKNSSWHKRTVERELSFFMLMWGWRVEE